MTAPRLHTGSQLLQDWIEVSVTVTPESEEAFASALFEMGSEGVIQKESVTPGGHGLLMGYLPADDHVEAKLGALRTLWTALSELGLAEGSCQMATRAMPTGEWATAWQKWFRSIEVSDRMLVAPPGEAVEARSGQIVMRINPGMAFGTGAHETTRLCLLALEQEVRPGDRVLDVGTGSSILAIASALFEAGAVTGIDTDPDTIDNACENIALNGVERRVQVYTGDMSHPAITGLYRVIVSNIDIRTALALLSRMVERLASDGVMILSGILVTEAQRLTDALDNMGVVIKRRDTLGEWWSCVVSTPNHTVFDGR